jgi:hypothetical protein
VKRKFYNIESGYAPLDTEAHNKNVERGRNKMNRNGKKSRFHRKNESKATFPLYYFLPTMSLLLSFLLQFLTKGT